MAKGTDLLLHKVRFHGAGLAEIWNGLEQVWNGVERGLERARIENAPTYKLGGTAAASSYTALKDHGPAIREGMGQGPACSLQRKTRGLDQQSQTK